MEDGMVSVEARTTRVVEIHVKRDGTRREVVEQVRAELEAAGIEFESIEDGTPCYDDRYREELADGRFFTRFAGD